MPNRTNLILLALGLTVAALALRSRSAHAAATKAFPPVRDAGTEEMIFKPLHWDLQDETVDQSFPASDPPGNY